MPGTGEGARHVRGSLWRCLLSLPSAAAAGLLEILLESGLVGEVSDACTPESRLTVSLAGKTSLFPTAPFG